MLIWPFVSMQFLWEAQMFVTRASPIKYWAVSPLGERDEKKEEKAAMPKIEAYVSRN